MRPRRLAFVVLLAAGGLLAAARGEVIAGRGRMTVDDSVVLVEPGSVIYVPPGGKQSLENSGPAAIEFLCLVVHAWKPEDEEVLE